MTLSPEPPRSANLSLLSHSWHVGTLVYDRRQLSNVFAWMLWGDLCLIISEAVVLRMVPFQLHVLGASKAAIGLIVGSIYSLMNWIMNPLISTASDRHRSRLGRRMPFMLYTAIPITLFLAAFGYTDQIGGLIHEHLPGLSAIVAHLCGWLLPGCGSLPHKAQLTIAMIAVLMVLFRFFDLFPGCVYYYLFADVIPQTVMGTFICLFGVTSAVGTILFHYFLLPIAGTHPALIYDVSSGLYFFTFTLLPLMVKEGEYPPPPLKVKGRPIGAIIRWAREVFSIGFYWKGFLTNSAYRWAYVPFNLFLIVYAQEALGIGEGSFGKLMTIALLAQMPALFLLGPLLDKYHPTRVGIFGFAIMILSASGGFFFIHNKATFIGFTMAAFISVAIVKGAMSTTFPRLLPRARYGQFSAATSMVSETGMLVFSYACGSMLDHFGQRYLFAWMAGFGVFGLLMGVSLYRSWIALGGMRIMSHRR